MSGKGLRHWAKLVGTANETAPVIDVVSQAPNKTSIAGNQKAGNSSARTERQGQSQGHGQGKADAVHPIFLDLLL